MINLNTQSKFTLPPLANGDKPKLTGEKLFNTREIHGLPDSKYTITTTTDADVYVLPTSKYNNVRPVYTDTTVKFNGALDGGLAVASITDADFGTHSLTTTEIGGATSNITAVLDSSMNEVLLPNGDQVYALVGAKVSALTASGKLVDDSLQLSFVTVDDDGAYQPYTLPAGTYTYGVNGIYSWATARWKELPTGGSSTITTTLGGSSRGEILVLLKDNLDTEGYLNLIVTADADIDEDEGYTVTYSFKLDGTSAPTVLIEGVTTGNNTVPNDITTEGTGISVKSGLGVMSGMTAYFNGVIIKPQLLSVTVAGNDATVVIDNTNKLIADGLLSAEDSFTLVYKVPNEATL